MRTICVFCGSSPGGRPEYLSVVGELGRGLAGRGLRVVYGGAAVGAMGALADAGGFLIVSTDLSPRGSITRIAFTPPTRTHGSARPGRLAVERGRLDPYGRCSAGPMEP